MTLTIPSEEMELRPSDFGFWYDVSFQGMTGKLAELASIAAQATKLAFDADRSFISRDCEEWHGKMNPDTGLLWPAVIDNILSWGNQRLYMYHSQQF